MIYKITVPETNYWVEADSIEEAWDEYNCDNYIGLECIDPIISEDPHYYDDEPDDIDSDEGYDPYMGCITDDC